ncbi:mucin-5AC-like [Hyla sarda]|uniref:mucin-5AC-like n=1 Tax=Hyla sarda TaxID=327740 RepID=UPI0024C2377A|nr:mucin-5AC-like [Hyla sarda]
MHLTPLLTLTICFLSQTFSSPVRTGNSTCSPCKWTEWFNVDHPKEGPNGGDWETLSNITARGFDVCQAPRDIQCRSARFPYVPFEMLEYDTKCERNIGLICLNKNNVVLCTDFEVQFLCCSCDQVQDSPIRTTPQMPISTSQVPALPAVPKNNSTCPTCKWTDWFNVNHPKEGPNGGDWETLSNITARGFDVCQAPRDIRCRSGRFPYVLFKDLNYNTQCEKSVGLTCLNKNNDVPCIDFEVQFLCCPCDQVPESPNQITPTYSTLQIHTATKVPTPPENSTSSIRTATKMPTPPEYSTSPIRTATKMPTTPEYSTSSIRTATKMPTTPEYSTSTIRTATRMPTTPEYSTSSIRTATPEYSTSTIRTATGMPTTPEYSTSPIRTATKMPTTSEYSTSTIRTATRMPTTPEYSTSQIPAVPEVPQKNSTCSPCKWTDWFNVNHPKEGPNGGDWETLSNISAFGFNVCQAPRDIHCRSGRFPYVPFEDLNYNTQCEKSVGLTCLNKNNDVPCIDFEVQFLCCPCDQVPDSRSQTTPTYSTSSIRTATKMPTPQEYSTSQIHTATKMPTPPENSTSQIHTATKMPTTPEYSTSSIHTATKMPTTPEYSTSSISTATKMPTPPENSTSQIHTATKMPTTPEYSTSSIHTETKMPTTPEYSTSSIHTETKMPTTSEYSTSSIHTATKMPTTPEYSTSSISTATKMPTTPKYSTSSISTATKMPTPPKYSTSSISTATKMPTTPKYSTSRIPAVPEVPKENSTCSPCKWTEWFNVNPPKDGPNGGDWETLI